MNNDWQPGDLALCVRGGELVSVPHKDGAPKAGKIYTVAGVAVDAFFITGRAKGLDLKDGPKNNGSRIWIATRFVKVTPPEADEFDREVIDLMQKQGEDA